jgi:hypothetical protein
MLGRASNKAAKGHMPSDPWSLVWRFLPWREVIGSVRRVQLAFRFARPAPPKIEWIPTSDCTARFRRVATEVVCSAVRALSLRNCRELRDFAPLQYFSRLRHLCLRECQRLVDDDLRHLLPLQELRSLNLAYCSGLQGLA